jgi:hypothetical protein
MKPGPGTVLLVAVMGCTAFAGPEQATALAPLKGRYGFNWFGNPAKAKCVQINDKLLKDFEKNYRCELEERTDSASGQPHVSCTQKDESKEYTIFKTKALCEGERETQMANGT